MLELKEDTILQGALYCAGVILRLLSFYAASLSHAFPWSMFMAPVLEDLRDSCPEPPSLAGLMSWEETFLRVVPVSHGHWGAKES